MHLSTAGTWAPSPAWPPGTAWPGLDRRTGARRCVSCGRVVAAPVAVCFCCRTVAAQLGLPLVSLVALCEYRVGDGTHRHLRGYKDARSSAGRDGYRRRLVTGLDVILATAIPALADSSGGQLVVTTVPSSHRPGPAPVEALVDGVAVLRSLHLPLLVRGPAHLGHLQAHRRAFRTAPGVGPGRTGRTGRPGLRRHDHHRRLGAERGGDPPAGRRPRHRRARRRACPGSGPAGSR